MLTTSSAARYSGGGGGSSSMGAGTYHPSYQQQQPWGTGTGAPLLVRHDFRASPACVVGLRLAVRNCASEAAEGVVVEVSPGWDVGVSPPLLSPGGGGGVEVNPARLFHPSLDMGIRAAPCRPMSDPAHCGDCCPSLFCSHLHTLQCTSAGGRRLVGAGITGGLGYGFHLGSSAAPAPAIHEPGCIRLRCLLVSLP